MARGPYAEHHSGIRRFAEKRVSDSKNAGRFCIAQVWLRGRGLPLQLCLGVL